MLNGVERLEAIQNRLRIIVRMVPSPPLHDDPDLKTLLYDLGGDKLVWAGQSETTNPSNAESWMRELLRSVGDELQKAGLVNPRS